jgi:capsular exopolysaccharide synthesis family protein
MEAHLPDNTNGRLPRHEARLQIYDIPALASSHERRQDPGLLEYWSLVKCNKLFVCAMVVLGAAAGFLYTLPQKPLFRSAARIEIQEPNDNFLNTRDLEPTSRRTTTDAYIQTEIEVLGSRPLLDRATQRLISNPNRKSLYYPDILSLLMRGVGLNEENRKPTNAELAKGAAASVVARGLRGTNIVEISGESNDPLMAAEFVNTLTDVFIQHDIETRLEAAQNTGRWLQEQIAGLRKQLEGSEKKLQQYAQGAGLLMNPEKGLVTEEKLRQVQQELSAAQGTRMQAEARYRIAQAGSPEALSDVLNDSSLRTIAMKISELRGQLIEQRTLFTPEHYKVRRLQEQIDELETTLSRERDQIVRRIANDFKTAKMREDMLGEAYARQASVVAGQGASLVDYNLLQRDVDTNRHVYEAMLQKVREASVASAVRASTIRVINRATPSNRPVSPDVKRFLLLGLTSGLFFAIAILAVRDKLDSRLREPGEVRQANVPELGVILSADRILVNRAPLRLPAAASANGDRAADALPDETGGSRELLTWTHKPSAEAESFRAVLTSLITFGPERRTVLFTSAVPKEGKTTIVCNLAVAMAEIDRKVLIIDADLREPRVHTIFDVPNNIGLSDIAQERRALGNYSVESLVRRTHIPNVYVLPSGPGTASVFRLLYSSRIDEFLQAARKEFGMVLIDTPPMLGIPDARVLAPKTDGVVLVMRSRYITRSTARAALDQLVSDGVPIIGTVLNDWKPRADQHGYYSRYYTPHV